MSAVIKDTRVNAVLLAGPYNRAVIIATHYWYVTSTTGIFSIMLDTVRETKWPVAVSSNNFPRRHVLRGANMRLIQNVRSRIQHKITHIDKKNSQQTFFLQQTLCAIGLKTSHSTDVKI